MLKIIITGPESSGKTTLSKKLAKHFNLSLTHEFAREYIDKLNRAYQKNDLIAIAKEQLHSEEHSELLDTDLITLKIWSLYKYGSCDNWILENVECQKKENRLYVLCKPDINWKADSQRENPHDREELFSVYEQELLRLKHDYFIVEGENRLKKCITKIAPLISVI